MNQLNLTIVAAKDEVTNKFDGFLYEVPLFFTSGSYTSELVRTMANTLKDYGYNGPEMFFKVEEVCYEEYDAMFRQLYEEKLNKYKTIDARPMHIQRAVKELTD